MLSPQPITSTNFKKIDTRTAHLIYIFIITCYFFTGIQGQSAFSVPDRSDNRRQLWEHFGVICDDLSAPRTHAQLRHRRPKLAPPPCRRGRRRSTAFAPHQPDGRHRRLVQDHLPAARLYLRESHHHFPRRCTAGPKVRTHDLRQRRAALHQPCAAPATA